MRNINRQLNRVAILMVMLIFSCSMGYTQQAISIPFLEKLSSDSTQQEGNFFQNIMDTIKTLIGSQEKFKKQMKENKRQMREIQTKTREVQADMKRQQRDTKAKIKDARARQREQMRLMQDKLRR